MNDRERVVSTMSETIISEDTGEIKKELQTHSYKMKVEPNFIKMYLGDLVLLVDLPKGISSVLYQIIKYMGYNNIVVLNKGIKSRIAKELNSTVGTVSQAITPLVQKEILIREDRGVYLLNPYLFGKGKWEDIRKIRLYVDYTPQYKKIQTNIIKDYELNTSETNSDS